MRVIGRLVTVTIYTVIYTSYKMSCCSSATTYIDSYNSIKKKLYMAIICLFVRAMVGWVTLPFFSFLFL